MAAIIMIISRLNRDVIFIASVTARQNNFCSALPPYKISLGKNGSNGCSVHTANNLRFQTPPFSKSFPGLSEFCHI